MLKLDVVFDESSFPRLGHAVNCGHDLIYSHCSPMITGGRTVLGLNSDLAYGSDFAIVGLANSGWPSQRSGTRFRSCWASGPHRRVPGFIAIVVGTLTVIPGWATLRWGCCDWCCSRCI